LREGLKSIAAGDFGDMTKVDTLRVMAASHVIVAVVLIGNDTKFQVRRIVWLIV